jgi:hypothetical protein
MWYGAHEDLQIGNVETYFLSLEVDFSAVLHGFFSFSYLVAHPVGRASYVGAGHLGLPMRQV